MKPPRIRRALCALLVLGAMGTSAQIAYGWSGTNYFSATASPNVPEYTSGWAYRIGNRQDTGTGFVPVEIWSLTSSYIVTDDWISGGSISVSYPTIYRRQGCWNPGISPFQYPYSFSCYWV
jgi:hypothetical protein